MPAGVWHDDGVYMLVGKAIADGHGLRYEGVSGAPPAAKFPPLYPVLLAAFWLTGAGIGAVTFAATAANLLFLAAAAGLLAKALRDSTGLGVALSALTAGAAFVSADVLRAALVPLSESFFLLLIAGAFVLWSEAERDAGGRARAALALVLVAAVATRSAGLALVLGFGLAFVARRRLAWAATVAGPALLLTGAWSWWSGMRSAEIPEGTRDLLGSYGSWLADQTVAAPGAFLAGLPAHALGIGERMALLLLPGLYGWWLLAAAVPAALLVGVGLRHASRRFPPFGWFVPIYVGMLLLWPYLDRRLLVPLHPLLVGLLVLGGVTMWERLRAERMRRVVIAAGVAWISAYSVVTAARVARDWPVAPYRLRAERLAAAVEVLSRTAPDGAVVGAPEYWAALHLHGGWTVSPSVRFDPRSVDPDAPMWGTAEEQISLWRTSGIDHLVLEQGGILHGDALDALEAECPGRVVVLARTAPLVIVRLAWDAPCGPGAEGSETREPRG